ncbi:MAG: MerR family transcriptional regulator [Bacillota bacterium]|nr:MerR family transcriptional regulator [Bacillota bacterium]
MKVITISHVAKASNVNIETVRYYERRGLIDEPPRTESGYRQFPQAAIERIQFIKKSQDLGFSLEEIKKILLISDSDHDFNSKEIHQLATGKIQEIEQKIWDFNSMKRVLEELVKKCPGSGISKSQCPIINKLKGEGTNG